MISLNKQPVEKLDYQQDGSLEVVGQPWYTIQGEGPFAGKPAVFLRLAGCDLQCPNCDTDYTTGRVRHAPHDLYLTLRELLVSSNCNLVVVTGGEPFRQNMGPLVRMLLNTGFVVQIETNGTIYPDTVQHPFPSAAGNLHIVCSPKCKVVAEGLHRWISAYKYVLDADNVDPQDGLPMHTLGNSSGVARPHEGFIGEVYVQPAEPALPDRNTVFDEAVHERQRNRNVQAAVESCMKYGYRLSIQVHKVVGIP